MTPNLNFLRKVAEGGVKRVRGYTMRKGGYDRFIGGKATWEKHYRAGYVTWAHIPLLGRPGLVELTDAGRAALASADTHPKGGDVKQAPAPLSGAVGAAETPKGQHHGR